MSADDLAVIEQWSPPTVSGERTLALSVIMSGVINAHGIVRAGEKHPGETLQEAITKARAWFSLDDEMFVFWCEIGDVNHESVIDAVKRCWDWDSCEHITPSAREKRQSKRSLRDVLG